jgi:Holliday junction DNA helicase RuvA
MIGKLKGKIEFIGEDKLILDVNGVGYNVYASAKTLDFLQAKKDQEFSLLIETIVREDSITLYGFLTQTEQSWFNELCKVNGVGNKVALKILGILSINDIILALNSGDKSVFSRVSGIGPKLALRIVSELKDSAKKLSGEFFVSNQSANSSQDNPVNSKISSDAISALENLGYKRSDIYSIVGEQLNQNPDMTLETLITQSLRLLSK